MMAEEIVNKHIILEFVYVKNTLKNALKFYFNFCVCIFLGIKIAFLYFCQNVMVLGVKIAEIFEKNNKNTIFFLTLDHMGTPLKKSKFRKSSFVMFKIGPN